MVAVGESPPLGLGLARPATTLAAHNATPLSSSSRSLSSNDIGDDGLAAFLDSALSDFDTPFAIAAAPHATQAPASGTVRSLPGATLLSSRASSSPCSSASTDEYSASPVPLIAAQAPGAPTCPSSRPASPCEDVSHCHGDASLALALHRSHSPGRGATPAVVAAPGAVLAVSDDHSGTARASTRLAPRSAPVNVTSLTPGVDQPAFFRSPSSEVGPAPAAFAALDAMPEAGGDCSGMARVSRRLAPRFAPDNAAQCATGVDQLALHRSHLIGGGAALAAAAAPDAVPGAGGDYPGTARVDMRLAPPPDRLALSPSICFCPPEACLLVSPPSGGGAASIAALRAICIATLRAATTSTCKPSTTATSTLTIDTHITPQTAKGAVELTFEWARAFDIESTNQCSNSLQRLPTELEHLSSSSGHHALNLPSPLREAHATHSIDVFCTHHVSPALNLEGAYSSGTIPTSELVTAQIPYGVRSRPARLEHNYISHETPYSRFTRHWSSHISRQRIIQLSTYNMERAPVRPLPELISSTVPVGAWHVDNLGPISTTTGSTNVTHAIDATGYNETLDPCELCECIVSHHMTSATTEMHLSLFMAELELLASTSSPFVMAILSDGSSRQGGIDSQTRRQVGSCTFCDAYCCQGTPCVCRWDSEVALTTMTSKQQRYVRMARAWHHLNKGAATLKGVRFDPLSKRASKRPSPMMSTAGAGSNSPSSSTASPPEYCSHLTSGLVWCLVCNAALEYCMRCRCRLTPFCMCDAGPTWPTGLAASPTSWRTPLPLSQHASDADATPSALPPPGLESVWHLRQVPRRELRETPYAISATTCATEDRDYFSDLSSFDYRALFSDGHGSPQSLNLETHGSSSSSPTGIQTGTATSRAGLSGDDRSRRIMGHRYDKLISDDQSQKIMGHDGARTHKGVKLSNRTSGRGAMTTAEDPVPHCLPTLAATRPLLATSVLAKADRFPITSFAPRLGRGPAHERWRSDANRLFAAFGLVATDLHRLEPPSFDDFILLCIADIGIDTGDATLRGAYDVSRAQWYAINTAIYWHLLPSLVFSPEYYLTDTREVDGLRTDSLADGRGLLHWAEQWCHLSSDAYVDCMSCEPPADGSSPEPSLGDGGVNQLTSHIGRLSLSSSIGTQRDVRRSLHHSLESAHLSSSLESNTMSKHSSQTPDHHGVVRASKSTQTEPTSDSDDSDDGPLCGCLWARANGKQCACNVLGADGLSQVCRELAHSIPGCNCPCEACHPRDEHSQPAMTQSMQMDNQSTLNSLLVKCDQWAAAWITTHNDEQTEHLVSLHTSSISAISQRTSTQCDLIEAELEMSMLDFTSHAQPTKLTQNHPPSSDCDDTELLIALNNGALGIIHSTLQLDKGHSSNTLGDGPARRYGHLLSVGNEWYAALHRVRAMIFSLAEVLTQPPFMIIIDATPSMESTLNDLYLIARSLAGHSWQQDRLADCKAIAAVLVQDVFPRSNSRANLSCNSRPRLFGWWKSVLRRRAALAQPLIHETTVATLPKQPRLMVRRRITLRTTGTTRGEFLEQEQAIQIASRHMHRASLSDRPLIGRFTRLSLSLLCSKHNAINADEASQQLCDNVTWTNRECAAGGGTFCHDPGHLTGDERVVCMRRLHGNFIGYLHSPDYEHDHGRGLGANMSLTSVHERLDIDSRIVRCVLPNGEYELVGSITTGQADGTVALDEVHTSDDFLHRRQVHETFRSDVLRPLRGLRTTLRITIPWSTQRVHSHSPTDLSSADITSRSARVNQIQLLSMLARRNRLPQPEWNARLVNGLTIAPFSVASARIFLPTPFHNAPSDIVYRVKIVPDGPSSRSGSMLQLVQCRTTVEIHALTNGYITCRIRNGTEHRLSLMAGVTVGRIRLLTRHLTDFSSGNMTLRDQRQFTVIQQLIMGDISPLPATLHDESSHVHGELQWTRGAL